MSFRDNGEILSVHTQIVILGYPHSCSVYTISLFKGISLRNRTIDKVSQGECDGVFSVLSQFVSFRNILTETFKILLHITAYVKWKKKKPLCCVSDDGRASGGLKRPLTRACHIARTTQSSHNLFINLGWRARCECFRNHKKITQHCV